MQRGLLIGSMFAFILPYHVCASVEAMSTIHDRRTCSTAGGGMSLKATAVCTFDCVRLAEVVRRRGAQMQRTGAQLRPGGACEVGSLLLSSWISL